MSNGGQCCVSCLSERLLEFVCARFVCPPFVVGTVNQQALFLYLFTASSLQAPQGQCEPTSGIQMGSIIHSKRTRAWLTRNWKAASSRYKQQEGLSSLSTLKQAALSNRRQSECPRRFGRSRAYVPIDGDRLNCSIIATL